MNQWPDQLRLELVKGSGGKTWKLLSDFSFSGLWPWTITAPAGFETDGASIPRFFWRLIGPPLAGKYAPAAVLHDYLYQRQIFTRRGSDVVFKFMMETLGVPQWKINLIYYGVRLGGWLPWRNHARSNS